MTSIFGQPESVAIPTVSYLCFFLFPFDSYLIFRHAPPDECRGEERHVPRISYPSHEVSYAEREIIRGIIFQNHNFHDQLVLPKTS